MDFILPDSNITRDTNKTLLEYTIKCKDRIYNDFNIKSVYGILAHTIWSGGRVTSTTDGVSAFNFEIAEIEGIVSGYKSFGVTYLLVFTNPFITKDMLFDYWGNKQLEIVSKYGGGVILNSELLYNYIKEKYPSLTITQSVTKNPSIEETLNDFESDKYDYVVINTKYNTKLDIVKDEFRQSCEILINDCCPANCKNRLFCYNKCAYDNLGIDIDKDGEVCYNKEKFKFIDDNKGFIHESYEAASIFNNHLSRDYLIELSSKGFKRFKVEGRGSPLPMTLYAYAKYFILPEYKGDFIIDTIL